MGFYPPPPSGPPLSGPATKTKVFYLCLPLVIPWFPELQVLSQISSYYPVVKRGIVQVYSQSENNFFFKACYLCTMENMYILLIQSVYTVETVFIKPAVA